MANRTILRLIEQSQTGFWKGDFVIINSIKI